MAILHKPIQVSHKNHQGNGNKWIENDPEGKHCFHFEMANPVDWIDGNLEIK